MSQTRINVRSVINAKSIRREVRNGRDVIIVPSATLPDDVIMNRVRYPAAEIEKAYKGLEGTPAPLGHPTINGAFVSALDPRGLALSYVGAHNENVRRENGRVMVDKVIDVEVASQLERGKRVLNAIDKGEPIHTSTGLFAVMSKLSNDKAADFEASEMIFDHDAILLDEEGAATPDQGVGMLVNKALDKSGAEIGLLNSSLDDIGSELDWIAGEALRMAEKADKAPLIEKIKAAILRIVKGESADGADPVANNAKGADMPVNEDDFKKLSDQVKTLGEGFDKIGETIATAVANAVKPLVDAHAALANAAEAEAKATLEGLQADVVKAGLMGEAEAKELTANVAKALLANQKPGRAAALNNAMPGKVENTGFVLPKGVN